MYSTYRIWPRLLFLGSRQPPPTVLVSHKKKNGAQPLEHPRQGQGNDSADKVMPALATPPEAVDTADLTTFGPPNDLLINGRQTDTRLISAQGERRLECAHLATGI